jgi:hypothetical protein
MKLIQVVMMMSALTAPLAMAQTETAPDPNATPTTTEPAHVWNPDWGGQHFQYCPSANKYADREFSFDMFASYTHVESSFTHLAQTDLRSGGAWGGGVGGNFFFTKLFGIGVDANMPNDGGNLINSVNGSLMLRLPIEPTGLAPYLFGGGGRTTDRIWDWTGHAGVGLEYRMNPLTGVFIDARYTWGDKSPDNALFRAGFRFVF